MLDLLLPGLVNTFCSARAEVVSRQFCFLTLSSVFFSVGIKAGGFEFGCVGRCLPVGTSAIFIIIISPSLSVGVRARLM